MAVVDVGKDTKLHHNDPWHWERANKIFNFKAVKVLVKHGYLQRDLEGTVVEVSEV